MKTFTYTVVIATALLFSAQAHATLLDNTTWRLSNNSSDYGVLQRTNTGTDRYVFGVAGEEIIAKYANNELVISGKVLQTSTNSLLNIYLKYDNIEVAGMSIRARDNDIVGRIGTHLVLADNSMPQGSFTVRHPANNARAVFDGWFRYENGQKFGDLHANALQSPEITSAVSEPTTSLTFLSILGLFAFRTYRFCKKI